MALRIAVNDSDVGQFVADRAGCAWVPDTDHCIGVVDDDRPAARVRGGVIYTSFTGASCFMHVAGRDEKWITQDMLTATFHFPFVQLGCGVVFGVLDENNMPARRFNARIGWREIATLPGMFASSNGIVVTMSRGECRWLGRRLRTVTVGGDHGRR